MLPAGYAQAARLAKGFRTLDSEGGTTLDGGPSGAEAGAVARGPPPFSAKRSHFSGGVTGGAVNVDVYRRRWWYVSLRAAGGLEALEFVEGPVEAPFYGRFVAGELREGVRLVRVPDEGPAEPGGLVFLLGLHLLCLREGFLVLLPVPNGILV